MRLQIPADDDAELLSAGTDPLSVLETAGLLRELTARLIGIGDFDEALTELVRIGREAVAGVAGAGFTLLRAGSPAGAAASEERFAELDGVAHGADTPALTAIRRRELVVSDDLATEERWQPWTARARELGVRAAVSAPLDIDEQMLGAINLYVAQPRRITARWQLTAMLLAEHAGLLLAAVRDRARQAELVGELDRLVANGDVVDQAIGVIMTQRGCRAEEALQVLRSASTALHVPVPEVAQRLISTVARPRQN
ncbi:GAF domain-containing protein [Melissospora conviva]|uniref:GAF domain-containing protein n=1 Tax=Melissospora conviva TaxID=3388432 RepID=UPI003B7E14E9